MSAPLARLAADAANLYRPAGRWAYHFAHGKLSRDPLFPALLTPGLLPAEARILDLGCGQGLLAAWLRTATRQRASASNPAPRITHYHGIELHAAAVERGRIALGRAPSIHLQVDDITTATLPTADVITLIDVLHYLPPDAQETLLSHIRTVLPPHGRLLLRIGNADAGFAHRLSRLTDSLVVCGHGGGWPSLHCRTLDAWLALLQQRGFRCETQPMGGAGFANVLILAQPC